jgi:opacity protein-like surface antigen
VPRSVKMPAALAVALLLGAAPARAQSVQITPFVGYAFGGSVRDTVLDESRSFDAALAYGGTLSFPISQGWRFELLYSRQETKLANGLGPSFDVTIERYLGGFQEEKGDEKVRWFGTVWFGATRFIPGLGGFDSETKFGAGVGLGVKTFPVKNVGLRLEARGFYTLVKGEGGAFCANGTCLFAFSGTGLWQGDVSAGLILAF